MYSGPPLINVWEDRKILKLSNMKDITDTVNDVCMVRQCNLLHRDVTVAMLSNWLQLRPYCVPYSRLLFEWTLLLRPRWTPCPVQIRAHHHINVYTDINESIPRVGLNFQLKSWP